MSAKVYVDVISQTTAQGIVTPLSLRWSDGRVFEIARVVEVRQAASMKAGGIGVRYTCIIAGKPKTLFYEGPRWFVEAKQV